MASKTKLERLREAERELETQLTKLRKQITIAERGQNARIKDTNKYIDRTNKLIARQTKEQAKIQEKELAKLEYFLGESFETLKEAREALTKQTQKATRRERLAFLTTEREKRLKRGQVKAAERIEREITGAKLNPKRQVYTIRQLSKLENQQVIDFLSDRKTFQNVGLNYLQPNEYITVNVPYCYIDKNGKVKTARAVGRKVFKNWNELQNYINAKYIDEFTKEEWLGNIEIVKFETQYDYAVTRGKQRDLNTKHRKERKAYFKEYKKALIQKGREIERKAQLKGRK